MKNGKCSTRREFVHWGVSASAAVAILQTGCGDRKNETGGAVENPSPLPEGPSPLQQVGTRYEWALYLSSASLSDSSSVASGETLTQCVEDKFTLQMEAIDGLGGIRIINPARFSNWIVGEVRNRACLSVTSSLLTLKEGDPNSNVKRYDCKSQAFHEILQAPEPLSDKEKLVAEDAGYRVDLKNHAADVKEGGFVPPPLLSLSPKQEDSKTHAKRAYAHVFLTSSPMGGQSQTSLKGTSDKEWSASFQLLTDGRVKLPGGAAAVPAAQVGLSTQGVAPGTFTVAYTAADFSESTGGINCLISVGLAVRTRPLTRPDEKSDWQETEKGWSQYSRDTTREADIRAAIEAPEPPSGVKWGV